MCNHCNVHERKNRKKTKKKMAGWDKGIQEAMHKDCARPSNLEKDPKEGAVAMSLVHR